MKSRLEKVKVGSDKLSFGRLRDNFSVVMTFNLLKKLFIKTVTDLEQTSNQREE